MQKCTRCGHKLGKPKDNWAKCPKCGLSRFVGVKASPEPAEKDEKAVPSPIEAVEEKTETKAK